MWYVGRSFHGNQSFAGVWGVQLALSPAGMDINNVLDNGCLPASLNNIKMEVAILWELRKCMLKDLVGVHTLCQTVICFNIANQISCS